MHTLGIDVGGTKIEGILIDGHNQVIQREQVQTESAEGSMKVFTNIVQLISMFDAERIHSIGIGWPGFVTKEGLIQKTPNVPGFEGRYLAQELQELLGVSCVIGNDARVFTLAEHHQIKGVSTTLGIICGTGCGGGVVTDGSIYMGAHGYAGEIGHMFVGEHEAGELFAGPAVKDFCLSQEWEDDVRTLQKNMQDKKDLYKKQMQPLLNQFAGFIRNLVISYDVDDVVIGGSVGKHFWSIWVDEIEDKVRESLEGYPNRYQIRISALESAGAIGAALLIKKSEPEVNLK